jgi:hypothetical protein
MTRKEILADIEQAFGFVHDWLNDMPDAVLEQYWTNHVWQAAWEEGCTMTAQLAVEFALTESAMNGEPAG